MTVINAVKNKLVAVKDNIKDFFTNLGLKNKIKEKFSKKTETERWKEVIQLNQEFKELAEQANMWIDEAIVQEYRDTGGIPIRAGKYTKTFLKWYDLNYA